MENQDKQNLQNPKELLKEFGDYIINFFMSVLIGLGISLLLDLPMKFLKIINLDLGRFIVYFLSMCIALYARSYRRSYYANSRTYTFQIKKVLFFVGMTFVIQILLAVIIGHTVYFTGPTHYLAFYVLFIKNFRIPEAQAVLTGYSWLFMLLAEVLIYAPIMILGEYFGAKQSNKEIDLSKQR